MDYVFAELVNVTSEVLNPEEIRFKLTFVGTGTLSWCKRVVKGKTVKTYICRDTVRAKKSLSKRVGDALSIQYRNRKEKSLRIDTKFF